MLFRCRPTHVFWPQRDCWSIATCHSNLFMDAIRFFNKSHDSHLCNPLQYINNKWMRAVKMHTANAVSRCSASCCEVNESGFARERLKKNFEHISFIQPSPLIWTTWNRDSSPPYAPVVARVIFPVLLVLLLHSDQKSYIGIFPKLWSRITKFQTTYTISPPTP